MDQPMLELRDLSRTYGRQSALENLSLSLRQGDAYGLIGPNGAGETTTLKIAVTLLHGATSSWRIAGTLVRHGWQLLRLTPEAMDLERAYLNITRGSVS